jgi:radical SAM protein with 4Fe4S-binding SPASM domain
VKRFWNFVRIGASYLLSLMLRRAVHWGKPVSAAFEPVNRCNLRCPECPAGTGTLTRPQGMPDPGFFRNVIGQLTPELAYLTLYFQGEPFLNPDLSGMVMYAKSRKLLVVTSTNGHFLDREAALETVRSGLDKLIVSVDGADQESYSAYRKGGNLEKVVAGLHNLAEAKDSQGSRKPKTIIQCLLLKSNQHQKDAIRKLAKDVRANKVEFKTAQFNAFENGNPLMPEEKDSRYRELKSTTPRVHGFTGSDETLPPKYAIKNKLRNRCFRMWSSCVITWDGLVVPCCFDKDASQVMGDLKNQTFEEIWNGEKYRAFRNSILQNRKSVDICRNCCQYY